MRVQNQKQFLPLTNIFGKRGKPWIKALNSMR